MTCISHWLVVDESDGSVLAWWPTLDPRSRWEAERLAEETGHALRSGSWNGSGFDVEDGHDHS